MCDGADVFIGAVMEHIEEAGVHSGDSSCQIPPATLSDDELDEIEDITRRLARRLGVQGVLNLQLAVKDERIWVLEANPRASRTVPFVSKVIGVSLARIATLVLTGRTLAELAADGVLPADPHHYRHLPYTAVKAAVLPFGRFPGVDTVLGPGDEVDRRGHGDRSRIRAWRSRRRSSRPAPACPRAARSSCRWPTATSGRSSSRRNGWPTSASALVATSGTAGVLERAGHPRRARREGIRGAAQRGGSHPRWEGGPRDQHAVRSRAAQRRLLHPNGDRDRRGAVHHHACPACSRPCAASRRSVGGPSEPRSIQEHHADASGGAAQSRLSFAEATASVAGEAV